MCFILFYYDIFQIIQKECFFVCRKVKQSLSKLVKSFSGWLDKFDMSFGKSSKSWLSTNNSLSIIQSTVNNWSCVLHKLLWASSVLPELTHTGSGSSQTFALLGVAAQYLTWGRTWKNCFDALATSPAVHSLQQIMLRRVVNEERYEWSNVANAEALSYHSLKCCFLNINDIHDLFATSLYVNSW